MSDTKILHEIRNVKDNVFPEQSNGIKVYPFDGLGSLITPVFGAWGLPVILIPIDGITEGYGLYAGGDIIPYSVYGFNHIPIASPDNRATWQAFPVIKSTTTLLNATSGAGQPNPNRIEMADTSQFLVNDMIWVRDNISPNGEIRRIQSIVVNDYLQVYNNLVNTYTVAQSAKCYVIWRSGVYEFSSNQAADKDTKSLSTCDISPILRLSAGDGLIARGYGIENAAQTFYLIPRYDDCHC